jgi:prepilin-type N-terminal cleavage/methylation domain-containing protein
MKKGISLVELIIVITIIGIISAIVIPNYKSSADRLALERSAYKLAKDIRKASEMAMSTKRLVSGEVPKGGYGICFNVGSNQSSPCGQDNRHYSLYADRDESNTGGESEVIETFELEKKVYIKDVRDRGQSLNNVVSVSINFTPPAPLVKIKINSTDEYDSIYIVLGLENNPNQEKRIFVEKSGLVTVE